MAVNVLLDPAEMPARTQDQDTFDDKMAAVMQKLPILGQQINATEAGMNTIATGGAYAIPFVVDATGVTEIDPGAGKIRFNNGSQGSATALWVDILDLTGASAAATLDMFAASSSTVKGTLRLVKQGDASKWAIYNLVAIFTSTGYRALSVSPVASSTAAPFSNGDAVLLNFQRTGDKGDTGPAYTPQYMKVSDQKTAATSGGTSTALSTVTRTLNTTDANTITGASLSANTVTLPAGKYVFRGRAPGANCAQHRAALYNASDSVVVALGSNASSSSTGNNQSDSWVSGYLNIASAKQFTLRHTIGLGDSNGLGKSSDMNGNIEIYSELEFWKIG
jgi:hypothetical protein